MDTNVSGLDLGNKEVVVVYKHSRFSYAAERGSKKELQLLENNHDPISRHLWRSHEKNLRSIERVTAILDDNGIDHALVCRSDLSKSKLKNKLVIAVGGDGTLLDTSHYCDDARLLGVNSDPESSMGALCASTVDQFAQTLSDIASIKLTAKPIARLIVTINGKSVRPMALNDILFCHKNPSAMSRYFITKDGVTEEHRSSGLWVATAAGSTGGIYSSGADPQPLLEESAIFREREPYWVDNSSPALLAGKIVKGEKLSIRCNMTDGRIFIDGPHKSAAIALGDGIDIAISSKPLMLFIGPHLLKNRQQMIDKRKLLREVYG